MKSVRWLMRVIVVALLPVWAWASQLVVFGDSLSDVGNVFVDSRNAGLIPDPPPPYYNGRMSNGPIWIDYLAQSLFIKAPTASQAGHGGTGYAYAGSAIGAGTRTRPSIAIPGQTQTVSDTGKQIQEFLTVSPSGFAADQLVILWGGAQNLLQATLSGGFPSGVSIVSQTMFELESELRTLNQFGARRVLVPNQIDASSAPYFRDPRLPSGTKPLLSALTQVFNQQLDKLLSRLMIDATFQSDLLTVDMFGLMKSVERNPAQYGFENLTNPLIFNPSASNGDKYLFWDPIHPTTQGHRWIAAAALHAVPAPDTLVLMVLALGALATTSRRRTLVRNS